MRKVRLALCIPLAAGGLALACLALSAPSAVASTVPVTLDLQADVITAAHDGEALHAIVLTEKQIIAEGVQLVPQSEPLALQVQRLNAQILTVESAIKHEATVVSGVGHINSPTGEHKIEAAATDVRRFIGQISHHEAAAKKATSPLVQSFDLGGWRRCPP